MRKVLGRESGGEMLLNAVTVSSLYYLGSEPVPVDKTNKIPVARALFDRLDLEATSLDRLPLSRLASRTSSGSHNYIVISANISPRRVGS